MDRPILFSGPMVLALIAGRKTQTRRLFKGDAPHGVERCQYSPTGWASRHENGGCSCKPAPAAAAFPGQAFWVRENFAIVPATAYFCSMDVHQVVNPDDPAEAAIFQAGWDRSIPKWKPCIHMPRWASRLRLPDVEVRVERLQDISEADAIAEGLEWTVPGKWSVHPSLPIIGSDPVQVYRELWEHLHGEGSWAANPLVWVYSFGKAEVR